jgi:hypothetical protein
METPQLSRSQLLSRAIHRWWEIRSNRGLYPALQYQIRLGSIRRYASSLGWDRLEIVLLKEIRRAKESHKALQKGTVAFGPIRPPITRNLAPGDHTQFRGVAHDAVWIDEDTGEDRGEPDVWPGGGPVHPDDR